MYTIAIYIASITVHFVTLYDCALYSPEWYQMGLVHMSVDAAQLLTRALCQTQAHMLEEVLGSFCLLLHYSCRYTILRYSCRSSVQPR